MSEGPAVGSPTDVGVKASSEELLTSLADAVLALPGVVRLEPTLSTAGPRVLLGRRHTDGLHVLERSGEADVDVSLATSSTHQARTVAHQVRACVVEVVAAHGYTPGSVVVSVLTISPGEQGRGV